MQFRRIRHCFCQDEHITGCWKRHKNEMSLRLYKDCRLWNALCNINDKAHQFFFCLWRICSASWMKRFCNIRDLPVSGKESDRVSVFRGGTDCGEKSHVTSAWNAASIAVTQAGLQPQVVTQVTQVGLQPRYTVWPQGLETVLHWLIASTSLTHLPRQSVPHCGIDLQRAINSIYSLQRSCSCWAETSPSTLCDPHSHD